MKGRSVWLVKRRVAELIGKIAKTDVIALIFVRGAREKRPLIPTH